MSSSGATHPHRRTHPPGHRMISSPVARAGRMTAGWHLLALAAFAVGWAEEPEFSVRSRYPRERIPAGEAIVCPLVERAPTLDGTLDDPLWQHGAAHTASAFTQLGRMEVVSRQTMVYLCRD